MTADSSAQEIAVLKVIINKEEVGDFFLLLQADGDVWMKKEDFDKTRFKEGVGVDVAYFGEKYISIKSISGVSYSVNEQEATLDVRTDPENLRGQIVDIAFERPYQVLYTEGESAFLNYGVLYGINEESLGLSTEVGARYAGIFGTSTFNYSKTADEDRFTRLLTYVRKDFRKGMKTLTVGDVSGISGVLGSGLGLGGISFSKNFSIEPYFIKFPALDLKGTLETPSEIELYVNGQLTSRNTLSPGVFELKNLSAEVGSGTAEIVIKDIYGKKQVISRSFFYSDRFLKRGLHEYNYSLGFVRADYGEKSFSYEKPAFLSFHNYGFNEKFKLGYSAEASESLINVGPAVSFFVMKGVTIDTAFTFSNSEGESGYGAFLGYSYPGKFFSAALSARKLSRHYSNLSLGPDEDKQSLEFNVSAGRSFGGFGSLAVGYGFLDKHVGGETNRMSGTYRRPISKRAAFFVLASRTTEEGTDAVDDIFAGLNIFFGSDFSGSLDYTARDGGTSKGASVKKNIPSGTGFGMEAGVREIGSDTNLTAASEYQNNFGRYGFKFNRASETDSYSVSASGGVGYVDGTLFVSRPITDAFAKVKTDSLRGVRVYHYGNEMGRTGKGGGIIVPNMRSFHDNKLSIESRDIPINYVVKSTNVYVSPPFRGGSVVGFDVTKVQGLSGSMFLMRDGKKTPLEFAKIKVRVKGGTIEGMIGKRGEFYIENVPPGKHKAKVEYGTRSCSFDIIIPVSYDIWVSLGDLICEEPK